MLCDSTKTLLQSVLQSLELRAKLDGTNRIESGNQCLYEMHQMTRPLYRAYRTTSSDKWPTHVPDSERLNRAMPHVKAMVRAIRHRYQATALVSGKAALAEMNGTSPSKASGLVSRA
jgi:hypothetical protein